MRQKDSVNGSIRGRLPDGTANPIDLHVGAQLKKARLEMGMSQEKLAEKMGITFQQVQKYEKGLNRIGASRLWDLSQVLHKPIRYFYEGMRQETREQSPRKINSFGEGENVVVNIEELALTPADLELIRYFKRIHNPVVAQSVLRLMESLSSEKREPSIPDFASEPDDNCSIEDV